MKRNYNNSGFSLVELLVAMALGLIVLSVTGYAFSNASKASTRALGGMTIHSRARIALGMMRRDLENMVPTSGIDFDSTGMTFLTARSTCDLNFDGNDANDSVTSDLGWVSWWVDKTDPDNFILVRTFDEAVFNATDKYVPWTTHADMVAKGVDSGTDYTILEDISGDLGVSFFRRDGFSIDHATIPLTELDGLSLRGKSDLARLHKFPAKAKIRLKLMSPARDREQEFIQEIWLPTLP